MAGPFGVPPAAPVSPGGHIYNPPRDLCNLRESLTSGGLSGCAAMCGFAGIVAWDERYRVDRETLAKMSARIAHRGPDGEGLWLNHEQELTPDRPQVGLVHRRLAIIDPDPRANQPFTDGQGRWLVYNGEIYNFRELRAELKTRKPDYEWRTDCDTEVLLVAYDVWGEKCVEHFNGMFAFAIWDGTKNELLLARDRMGQKPLYYTLGEDRSEEHTSELQSQSNVVCRLLLEKK